MEVGCLLYGTVRNCVREANHQGLDIRVEEGSGWLSRPFWFIGPEGDLRIFCRAIERLFPPDIEDEE